MSVWSITDDSVGTRKTGGGLAEGGGRLKEDVLIRRLKRRRKKKKVCHLGHEEFFGFN